MSDTSTPTRKISREGIVLIKSFEGFRPRAVRREDGGWVIGYGHTLSAREGATVSESDAELLLRYDLLPVEKRVNQTAQGVSNQHQFDALVSFAFSVGSDRFEGSDVLARMNAGAAAEAAEAMMAWPEPATPETGLRRRAAERALFIADPDRPVSLADLLVAPLPQRTETPVEPEPERADDVVTASVEPTDPREAAVAALLGEAPATPDGDPAADADPPTRPGDEEGAPVIPSFGAMATDQFRSEPGETDAVAANDLEPARPETIPASGEPDPAFSPEASADAGPSSPELEVGETEAASVSPDEPRSETVSSASANPSAMAALRYAPYATPIVGPLPFLEPARPMGETPPVPSATDPFAHAPSPSESLILTSPDDAPEPVLVRPAWTPEERSAPEPAATDEGLFGEDLTLTQGGQPLLRHDHDMEPPAPFDWSETGAFIIMGAVGLTAFGASMAAFRLASEQSRGGDETSIIGWVLAVIGVACVGVSSLNLYRRFGLPGGDR